MRFVYSLYNLMSREGVIKNMKTNLLGIFIVSILWLALFRHNWSEEGVLQWNIELFDVWIVVSVAVGTSLVRGLIELALVLSGGSISKKRIVR